MRAREVSSTIEYVQTHQISQCAVELNTYVDNIIISVYSCADKFADDSTTFAARTIIRPTVYGEHPGRPLETTKQEVNQ